MVEAYWINNLKYDFIHLDENREIFMAFVDEYGIEKFYTGLPLWPKMYSNKFVRISELSDYEKIPYASQVEMYERYDGSRVLVAHFNTFENVSFEELDQMIHYFALDRGLSYEWLSYDESWFNVGVSLTCVFEIEDLDLYLDYIKQNKEYDSKLNKHYI